MHVYLSSYTFVFTYILDRLFVLHAQITDKFQQNYEFVDCAAFLFKSGSYTLSSFLHFKQKPEVALFLMLPNWKLQKMPINSQMDRYIVVHSPKGLLCSNENECTVTT